MTIKVTKKTTKKKAGKKAGKKSQPVNLRIGFLPQMSFLKEGDSGVRCAIQTAEYLGKWGADCFLFCPKVYHPAEPVSDRVHFVEWDGVTGFLGAHENLSDLHEYIHPIRGTFPLDIIYTSQTYNIHALRGWFWNCPSFENRPLIVLDEYMAYGPSNPTSKQAFTYSKWEPDHNLCLPELRVFATMAADYVLTDTSLERLTILDAAYRVLSPSCLRNLKDKIVVQPDGTRFDRIEGFKKEVSRNEEFTVFFGGRLNQLKRPEIMLKAFTTEKSLAKVDRVVITSPKKDDQFMQKLTKAQRECFEVHTYLGPDEFAKKAIQSHVVVYPSKGEGASVGVMEMVMAGPVMVLPDLPWVHAMFEDSLKGYPFLFHKSSEITGIIDAIRQDYDAAQKAMGPLRDYIATVHDVDVCSRKTHEWLTQWSDALCDPYVEKLSKKLPQGWELVFAAFDTMPDVFGVDELLKEVCKQSKWLSMSSFNSINATSKRYFTRTALIRGLRGLGKVEVLPAQGHILTEDRNVQLRKL